MDYLNIAAINSMELITIVITSAANRVSIKNIMPPTFLIALQNLIDRATVSMTKTNLRA